MRDWGHEPVRKTVTQDTIFSDEALKYANEEAASRAMAGAAFKPPMKETVRNPPMYNNFSGEGPRRHLQTQFSTKEDTSTIVPRQENEVGLDSKNHARSGGFGC